MEIYNEIQELLKKTEHSVIYISSYYGEELFATLESLNQEIHRVSSLRGVNHLLLLLLAKASGNNMFLGNAEREYPHPLAPTSSERHNFLYLLTKNATVSIYTTNGDVHVEQHVASMQSRDAKLRPSYRSAVATTLTEAIETLFKKDSFSPATCVPSSG